MVELNNFDANEVEPAQDFEVIPAGKYTACIVASDATATKKGDGHYLEVELDILEGDYKGRKLWDRLNLANPSARAVEIARATLSSICRAVGVMQPKDSGELHNKPLVIRVKAKKQKDTGDIYNEIAGYHKIDAQGGQPAQTTSDRPPWG